MIREEELVRVLSESPWERAKRQAAVEESFCAAVVPVACGWCYTFECVPGSRRCEHCVGKGSSKK